MGYFNQDQLDHMSDLASRNPASLCWCGWNTRGECHKCPPDKSKADRLRVQCTDPNCHNYPSPDDPSGKITHNIACRAAG